jgi:hypothetical protein
MFSQNTSPPQIKYEPGKERREADFMDCERNSIP